MAIEWVGVGFSYKEGFWLKRKRVLEDLSLSLQENTVLALVGPNGAGKTTTIKLGAGILIPETGKVLVDSEPVQSRKARAQIGLLTEVPYVYPLLTVKEWLSFGCTISKIDKANVNLRINEILEEFELIELENVILSRLSKGQVQRACLAYAILHQPKYLLLDEPLSGLDPIWRKWFLEKITKLKENRTSILFSTHILEDIEKICDQIAIINKGRLLWHGWLRELDRKITGYEIWARSPCPEKVMALLGNTGAKSYSGELVFMATEEIKSRVIRLSQENILEIIAIVPIREETKDIVLKMIERDNLV